MHFHRPKRGSLVESRKVLALRGPWKKRLWREVRHDRECMGADYFVGRVVPSG